LELDLMEGKEREFVSGPQLLMQQLGSMLDDEELSDVEVLTPTKSFSASKIILAGTKTI